ncbi:unnamed protein product [Lactuca saligna]|uniref:Leucine-rich repeat-containing N-terminal plant-type domain-containing protein n=1 Tax=Lactuca saligna TaxID=75948 RepID=A0AA35Z8P1_LACSI|nr:unnamed protein product [Lactuca saligna]
MNLFKALSTSTSRLVSSSFVSKFLLVGGGGGDDDKGVVNKCSDKERHALLDFKVGLQDPNGHLYTWRAKEDDCCKWFGVTCNNETGHVIELELWHSGLGGKISHSLVNLSNLNHLQLSFNSFHGPIPTFIGSMTQLRYLDLSDNGFNGIIPASLGSLTELSYLDLSHNSLYGTIPPEFGNLTNLEELLLGYVGRCRVENVEWMSHLSYLQHLEMDEISMSKANNWVNVVLGLGKLSHLSLQECELSQVMDPYSSFVNSSSSIEFLDLRNNNLTSSMYSWLFPLTNNKLRFLLLSNNPIDRIPKYLESLPDEIENFSNLGYLCLSHNHLNGTISEKVWELPKLETLDVSFNNLRGAISVNIGNSKVSINDLSKNSLEGVPSIDPMSNLSAEAIDLSSCNLGPQFPKWIQNLKHLTRLDISNTRISDTVPLDFWDTWPSRLHYLNLSSSNIS